MGEIIFADRFWFCRNVSQLGAPTLTRYASEYYGKKVPTSIVSAIERENHKRSVYSNALARVFKVDPVWLKTGKGKAPKGFDPIAARKGRLAQVSANRKGPIKADGRTIASTRQSLDSDSKPGVVSTEPAAIWSLPEEENKDAQQAELTKKLVAFAMAFGAEKVIGLLRDLEPVLARFGTEKVSGKNEVESIGKRDSNA